MNEKVQQNRFDTVSIDDLRKNLAEYTAVDDSAPRSLSGQFYTDPAFFNHECRAVLHRGWHCVGRSDEFAKNGDYLTLNLLGEPLIIVRDGDNIKALSNVCRHRGMLLAEGKGNSNRFVCRYHGWAYGLDGALLRAPRMKNDGFNQKTCKLGGFSCKQKFGFVYVSLSSNPPDIETELAGLDKILGNYEPERYAIAHSATEIWKCNWKSLVENFMEGYHLSIVHPQTLHGYTPTGLSKKGPNGAGYTSYFANYPDKIASRGPGAASLTREERNRSTLFAVFPCQVVSIASSLLVSLSIRPLSPASIELRWTMSVHSESLDPKTISERIKLWENVNQEDQDKLEAMQSALSSVFANGGPLAEDDYEGTIRDFLGWLAKQDASYGLN